jgi:hypothetical protein
MRRTRASHADLWGTGTGPTEADPSQSREADSPDKSFANHRQRIRDTEGKAHIPHAIRRAEERHGLKLTVPDLWDISHQCKLGYGRMKILRGGAEQHAVFIHGKELIVVWFPPTYGNHPRPDGVVATILPREAIRQMYDKHKKSGRKMGPPKKLPKKARQRGHF